MIEPQTIYHPLYEDKEKFIILVTGGRGSGKSFNASTFIERLTFEMTEVERIVHQILYTLTVQIQRLHTKNQNTI